jgi:hypothetical protein
MNLISILGTPAAPIVPRASPKKWDGRALQKILEQLNMENLLPKSSAIAVDRSGLRPRCPAPAKSEGPTPSIISRSTKSELQSSNGVGWAAVLGSDVINFLEAGVSRRTTPIEKAAIAVIFNLRICGSYA